MSVVATSVFLLFALIVLGFILGKRNIIHKESIPDLSALVLQVTMPVTVFCSIIDQERSQLVSYGVQTFLFIILLHLCALLVGLILIHAVKVQDLDQGVWIYSMLFSNNGFMGIPLALSGLFVAFLYYLILEVADEGKEESMDEGTQAAVEADEEGKKLLTSKDVTNLVVRWNFYCE